MFANPLQNCEELSDANNNYQRVIFEEVLSGGHSQKALRCFLAFGGFLLIFLCLRPTRAQQKSAPNPSYQ